MSIALISGGTAVINILDFLFLPAMRVKLLEDLHSVQIYPPCTQLFRRNRLVMNHLCAIVIDRSLIHSIFHTKREKRFFFFLNYAWLGGDGRGKLWGTFENMS